ncbi:hypothetical protein ACWD4T_32785, partial [Streptomyces umbrinus]
AAVRHRYMEYDTKAHAGRQLVSFRTQLALCDVRPGYRLPGKVGYQGADKKGRYFDITIEYGERWISVIEKSDWLSWEQRKS